MPTHGYKDYYGFKTNRLTGLVDATALEEFARSLPQGRENCPTFGHLHRLRRVYLTIANNLKKKEIARWRYRQWHRNYKSG